MVQPLRNLYNRGYPFTVPLAVVIAALYASAVCSGGIPALRHDWWWPVVRYGFHDSLTNLSSAWITNGIGYPTLLPGDYLIGVPIAALGLLAGPFATLVVFVFCIGLTCALAARSAALVLNASTVQTIAVEIFAVFNPWVYSETVAGHTFMLLAYGALLAIVAQALRSRPNALIVSVLLLLTVAQLQFFIIAVAIVMVIALLKKQYLPLVTACVIASPLLVGYVMERAQLLQTAYLASWQLQQSIDPLRAPILMGYFTGYADRLGQWEVIAGWTIVAAVVAVCVASLKPKQAALIGGLTIAALIASTGGRGPMSGPYMWIVAHVPFSAVFRELYDIIGFAAIGYVLLLCLPLRKWSWISVLAAAGALVGAASWLTYLPSRFWVDSRTMPIVSFSAPPNSRFALIPAFQPMRFDGKGSGADRDTYLRLGNVTTVNEYLSTYPADAALALYQKAGDADMLKALSVSEIVQRPWLHSDVAALRQQLSAFATASLSSGNAASLHRLSFLPELTVGPLPQAGTLVNVLGAGNIFSSDARSVRGPGVPVAWSSLPLITEVPSANTSVDALQEWVAARFAFVSDPADAQGLGGVYTTNAQHPFPLRGDAYALVNIKGALWAAPHITWRDTHGYAWIYIPRPVRQVYCRGRCFIAAQALQIGELRLNPPKQTYHEAPLKVLSPFLARASVSTHAWRLLRYNVRYDPQWSAYLNGHSLPHLRIDATVNGWLIPPNLREDTVWLVQRTAFLQFICECIGMSFALTLLTVYGLRCARSLTTRS